MAIKTFTTGEVLTAADTNTYLANSGLVFVKQVSVGSGVGTVDITSCFSSTYDNYKIVFNGIQVNTGISMNLFLLSGSTPTSSGWFGTEFYCATGGTTWTGQISANNVGSAYCSGATPSAGLASTIEIQSPNLAQFSRFQYWVVDSSYIRNGYAYHSANTQYDGCRLTTTSGGTLTGGSVTVYGYRKG
jgi:hypothetical protein